MHHGAGLSHDRRDLANRLDRANLVVRQHDRDEACLRREHLCDRLGLNDALRIGLDDIDHEAMRAHRICGVEDGMVWGRGHEDSITLWLNVATPPGNTLDGDVV